MLTFIKILEYELRPTDQNIYNYLSLITSQKIDPPTQQKEKLFIFTPVVLYSPLRRAAECINKTTCTKYTPMKELREIPFDLTKMCSKDEYNQHKSKIVRKKFKEMFITDKLLLPRQTIFREIKYVLQKCLIGKEKNITIVSHSFRLKIFEAFIKTAGQIENKPQLIEDFINNQEKTYNFGEGFIIKNL